MAIATTLRTWMRRQPLAAIGLVLLSAFVVAGLLAPWLAPANPAAIDLLHRLQGPSTAHWCGTDDLGRDTLSRLLWGARLSLSVSVSVVGISLALGLAIGGLAGYKGGWVDHGLTIFAMNTFLALPGILLAIAFAASVGGASIALRFGFGCRHLACARTGHRRAGGLQGRLDWPEPAMARAGLLQQMRIARRGQ